MEQVWGQCVDDYSIELVSLSRYTWIGNLNYLCIAGQGNEAQTRMTFIV